MGRFCLAKGLRSSLSIRIEAVGFCVYPWARKVCCLMNSFSGESSAANDYYFLPLSLIGAISGRAGHKVEEYCASGNFGE